MARLAAGVVGRREDGEAIVLGAKGSAIDTTDCGRWNAC